MSSDLIVFDPDGLDGMSGDQKKIMKAVNNYVDNYMSKHPASNTSEKLIATKPVQSFLDLVEGDYMSAYLDVNGRYCNLSYPDIIGDWANTVMIFSEAARKAGVILIDPQGIEPIITTPGGDGLLDKV